MKRILLTGLLLPGLLLYSTISFAEQIPELHSVRMLYQKASIEEKACKDLIEILSSFNNNINPLLEGYNGCATMMMAKYTFSPFSKLSYFKKGKKMLENAIQADGENIELRFLRFAAQTEIPSFLGYHHNIKSDKMFLLQSLPGVHDSELKEMITGYFKKCDCLTNNEKQQIK